MPSGSVRRQEIWMQCAAIARALHGLPMTIKSSIATAGYRCEIGSVLNKGDMPREDAVVVARLRAAGALILGTTNCPEFLMAYETANLLHGRTKTHGTWNARRADRAAASPLLLRRDSWRWTWHDSGGSVRVPAHFTGICSLKPTPGRIPGRGHLPPCVGRSRFSAPSARWRGPLTMSRCSFARCADRIPTIP